MAAVKLGAPKSSCLTQSIDRTTTPTPIPDPSLPREEVHGRERGFHDALATRSQPVKRPLDVFERAILDRIGDITGLQVLDLGCGDGVLTEALLRAGARVTALDISPGMIRLAQRRVTGAGLSGNAQFVVASAEETGLPDGGFDLVVGKWVLHHTDVIQTAREIRRVLRAGGRGIFIETSALNPLLAFARRRLAGRIGIPRYGTVDEHPLASADLAAIRGCFQRLHVSFPYFFFFGLFDRQVLRYRFRRVSRLAGTIDRAVQARLPALRRYSYYVLLEMDQRSDSARERDFGRSPIKVAPGTFLRPDDYPPSFLAASHSAACGATATFAVNGHQEFPMGGHEISPLTAISSPH